MGGAEGAKQTAEQVEVSEDSASSDEESKKSEASSDSSKSSASNSSASDSSDDGGPKSPKPPSAQAAQAAAPANAAAPAGNVKNKAVAFEERLRSELTRAQATGDPGLRGKLQKIRDQLTTRASSLQVLAGMNEAQVKDLLVRLERDYSSTGAAQKPKQPPGPPPSHLLDKPKQPPGPPPSHLLQASGPPPAQDAPIAQPTTPVEMTDGADEILPHRRPQMQKKSSIRGPRRRDGARIQFQLTPENYLAINEAPIVSYRGTGELLWFTQPGALVFCDSCGHQVPQCVGALSGAPQQSQFAQFQFLCNTCQGGSMYG